jgi:2-polyprenyl-3-methyl-5-hydroxy-6-metoxy-1,4-benzoquinol methylase
MAHIVTGNYFDKYGSKNPLVRWVVGRYLTTLFDLLERRPFSSVLDAGCGEGEIIHRIVERYAPRRIVGLDVDQELVQNLRETYPQQLFHTGSLEDYSDSDPYDVVLCLEVLEHIPDYQAALGSLSKLSAQRYIISVPNEPFFRLANITRLRYLQRGGNTPGHVNNFTHKRFAKMLSGEFPEAAVVTRTCHIWSFAHIDRTGL